MHRTAHVAQPDPPITSPRRSVILCSHPADLAAHSSRIIPLTARCHAMWLSRVVPCRTRSTSPGNVEHREIHVCDPSWKGC